MRLRIRLKLFLVMLALIVVSAVVAEAYVIRGVDAQVTQTIHDDLLVRVHVVAREASALSASVDDVTAWDGLADGLGATLDARVTLVGPEGRVLGDSEVGREAIARLENHGSRPEVAEAVATGRGESLRLSGTVGYRMLYVAVPFSHDGRTFGIARVAKPLRAVEQIIGRVRSVVWISSSLVLVLAIVLSGLAAQRMTRTLRDVTQAARRMSDGDLSVRTRVEGSDELAELGTALDHLADSLSKTLAELRTERDLQLRILQGMQEGVLVLDEEKRIVMVNSALRSMLLLGADVTGRPFLEVVRHFELNELVEEATASAGATAEIEIGGIKPRRLLVHASPFEGTVVGSSRCSSTSRISGASSPFVATSWRTDCASWAMESARRSRRRSSARSAKRFSGTRSRTASPSPV